MLDDPSESVEGIPTKPPKWFTQMYGSMLQEVKAVTPLPEANTGRRMASTREWGNQLNHGRSDLGSPPTCFRCGQVGHIRIGCQNTPMNPKPPGAYNKKENSGNYNRPPMWDNQRS